MKNNKMSLKVLIVDDEINLTMSIVKFLEKRLQCYGVYSYKEAIDYLKSNSVDLVITDIKLPDKDGFDLLIWLKNNLPSAKVIMMTAYGSPSVKDRAKTMGAIYYMEKPFDFNNLVKIIGKIFEKSGFSASIEKLELIDILQFFSYYDRAVVIEVENTVGFKGNIGIKNGKIMWAKTDDLSGYDALMTIMSWKGGAFHTGKYYDAVNGNNIDYPIMQVILDTSRIIDEESKDIKDELEVIMIKDKKEEEKENVDLNKIEESIKKFNEFLSGSMIATDVWKIGKNYSVFGINSSSENTNLFNNITQCIVNNIREYDFSDLIYYLIRLENNKLLIVCKINENYQWGVILDSIKTQFGVLINVALPRTIKSLQEALKKD